MKILLILLFSFIISFAKEDLYFLPDDSNQSIKEVSTLIENAKKSIDIAMYNFTYKKFAKLLKQSVKEGKKVTVIMDKKKVSKEEDTLYKYLKDSGIDVVLTKNKLHIKMAIFDKQIAVFGSANWKKKSFNKDYEIVYVTDKPKVVKRLNSVFSKLLLENK
ncbi:phospholipase D-like domain-containing protein [Arcobacter sp. CECT 8985]|uniref:phospholipase D-like domain-containing protein n=1 Tax=Arcobacter sp. CECT 8985 TaxID=1935424 RepID=UPI00100C29E1|nr:phospholipase D-like domain-containing protein [Arcobacter sp. CECT 8985]RXJ86471.1 endonuclease [Arcobacter sp. CECT 8985]